MASQFISIAALITDDSGTPDAPVGDGTQINSSLFAAIDAILNEFITRSAKVVGGVWTWESLGQHKFEAGGVGVQEVLVRNTLAGSGNRAAVTCQANSTSVFQMQMFSTTHTASGAITADGCRLVSNGVGLMSFETAASLGFSFYPAGARRVTIDFSNGAVAEHLFGWKLRNTVGSVINGISMNGSNNIVVGSDDGSGTNSTIIGGGGIQCDINVNSARRARFGNSGPELLLGTGNLGTIQTAQFGSGPSTPTSAQLLFGTDGTGWQLRLGKNQAGAITYLWKLSDAGHFSPMANNSYDIGTSSERIRDGYYTNINVTGLVYPNSDNAGAIGGSSNRFGSIYGVNVFAGDVHFENGWSFTEHYKLDIDIPGIALVDDEGELQLFIGKNKRFYTHDRDDISRIQYTRRTREERAEV